MFQTSIFYERFHFNCHLLRPKQLSNTQYLNGDSSMLRSSKFSLHHTSIYIYICNGNVCCHDYDEQRNENNSCKRPEVIMVLNSKWYSWIQAILVWNSCENHVHMNYGYCIVTAYSAYLYIYKIYTDIVI